MIGKHSISDTAGRPVEVGCVLYLGEQYQHPLPGPGVPEDLSVLHLVLGTIKQAESRYGHRWVGGTYAGDTTRKRGLYLRVLTPDGQIKLIKLNESSLWRHDGPPRWSDVWELPLHCFVMLSRTHE